MNNAVRLLLLYKSRKDFMMMKKIISVTLILSILSTQFALPQQAYAWWWSSSPKYDEKKTRKDTPQDFNNFLEACTAEERIQMLQALKDLPSLKDKYLGQLEGLSSLEHFTTRKNEVTSDKFLKPSTFNEVLPKTVLSAVKAGIIDKEAISVSAIRKALVWRAYNKTTYYFRGDKEINYHEILQWAATKTGVNKEQVNNLSTFALENRIVEQYFEAMWNRLDYEQRIAVLREVEKEAGVNIDKNVIATMGGAAALVALSSVILSSVVISGTSVPVFILSVIAAQTITGWLGFSFTAGEIGIGIVSLTCTPIGWAIIAGLAGTSVVFMGSPEKETVSTFIMTVNMIKTKRWGK